MYELLIDHFLVHNERDGGLTSACGMVQFTSVLDALIAPPPADAPKCGYCVLIYTRLN